MTKKLILATVVALSVVMVSCTTKPKDTPNSNSTNDTTTVEQNKDSNSPSQTQNSQKPKEDAKETKIKLSIYNIDDNTLEPNEASTIEVNEKATLDDKLKQLCKALSEKKFDNLSLELKSIDTVNGKKVATINLTDSSSKKWSQKFQGSTGGAVTSNTLIENFLQSSNKSRGEWIDGVKFLYNNEKIEYEHAADLSNIQYR